MRAINLGLFLSLALMLSLFFPASYIKAASSKEEVEELKKRMEELEREYRGKMEELMKRIEELEGERAREEKEAWWKKVEVEYKKPGDGFKIKTKDGNFSLKTKLRTQVQFSVSDVEDEDTATSLDIRRFRVYFEGNAFRPWLLYHFQLDGEGGSVRLRDAYFDGAYKTVYGQVFVPRVGQYKVPFNREELNSSSELQLVERSIVNEEFTFARDRGIGVYGVLGNYVTYGFGVFDGNGKNASSVDSNLLYVGRVQFGCCGNLEYSGESFPSGGDFKIVPNFGKEGRALFTVGLAGLAFPGLNIERKTPDNDIADRFSEIGTVEADVYGFSADANFKYGLFSVEGEYDFRKIDPKEGGLLSVSDHGFRVQGGVFLIPEFFEVAGRFAYIDFDDDVSGRDSAWEVTPGISFYLSRSHKWKVQLSYSFIRDKDTDGVEIDENVFRTQLQMYF